MALYRVQGVDVVVGRERVFYLEALGPESAAEYVRGREVRVEGVTPIGREEVPAGEAVVYVRSGESGASLPTALRRVVLVAIGLGIGALLILGTLFVLRAMEHLGRVSPERSVGR